MGIYVLINVALLSIVWYYLNAFSALYVWDSALYHYATYDLGLKIKNNDYLGFFRHIRSSLRYSDYNVFSQIFLMPIALISPTSRFMFISAISIVYIAPTIFMIYLYLKNILKIQDKTLLVLMVLYACMFLPIILPAVLGYQDIASLMCFIVIFYKYSQVPVEERSYKSLIIFALFLYLPFLFKKASLFGIVVFFIVFGLFSLFNVIKNKGFSVVNIKMLLLKYGYVAFIIILLMLLLQKQLVLQILLGSNYFNYYSDWQSSQPFYNFIIYAFPNYIGFFILILLTLGIVAMLSFRYNENFVSIYLITIHAVVTTFLFLSLQEVSLQHFQQIWGFLLFLLSIMLPIFLYMHFNRYLSYIWMLLIITINLSYFALGVSSGNKKIFNISAVSSVINLHKIDNLDTLNAMAWIDFQRKKEGKDLKIGLNSEYLGSEAFISYLFYYKNEMISRDILIQLPVLDNAHLIIFNNIFVVDLMVIGTPIKSLSSNQKIIELIVRDFVNNTSIAKSFVFVDSYNLKNSNIVYTMYRKIKPITKEQVGDFFVEYLKYHPQNKDAINTIILSLNN